MPCVAVGNGKVILPPELVRQREEEAASSTGLLIIMQRKHTCAPCMLCPSQALPLSVLTN